MSLRIIDTDVVIRFLTGDDPEKQARCQALFERVDRGEEVVDVPLTVVADAVHVLHSPRLYQLPKDEIASMLMALISLRGIRIHNRQTVLDGLALYGRHPRLDFTDALIVAMTHVEDDAVVYSYDRDYDRFAGIARREP